MKRKNVNQVLEAEYLIGKLDKSSIYSDLMKKIRVVFRYSWLDYLGVNSWVENTRFIAFKCPLKPVCILFKSMRDRIFRYF